VSVKKLWFCFRGPYDTNAWAAMWTREKLLDFFKTDDLVTKVLKKHPKFKTLVVESHRGVEDEDGRVFIWGLDEAGTEGPDTQHKGHVIELDGKVVYNDCTFDDEDDTDHDPKGCTLCTQVK
jgi:hypothetical protein